MKRHQRLITPFVLIVIATLYMFSLAVIVDTLGEAAVPFVLYTVIPTSIVLLLLLIAIPALHIIDTFHEHIMKWKEREIALRMKQADMAHHYRVNRKIRELELREALRVAKMRRFRVNRSVYRHQHNLRHRNRQNGW